jgi:hypothetical protein
MANVFRLKDASDSFTNVGVSRPRKEQRRSRCWMIINKKLWLNKRIQKRTKCLSLRGQPAHGAFKVHAFSGAGNSLRCLYLNARVINKLDVLRTVAEPRQPDIIGIAES